MAILEFPEKNNGGGLDDRLRCAYQAGEKTYGVLFAGFSLLNFNVIATTPAATFKPF